MLVVSSLLSNFTWCACGMKSNVDKIKSFNFQEWLLQFISPVLRHFAIWGQENTQNMLAYYTVSRGGRERNEPKFPQFTAFKLDFPLIVVHFIRWNETNFIGFLFCRVDEFHTRRMKNEKVASLGTRAKKYGCLVIVIQAE